MNENKPKTFKGLLLAIIAILIILLGTVLFLVLSYDKKDDKPDSKKPQTKDVVKEFTDYEHLYNTYYNEIYTDLYFKLLENNEAEVVESSCSEGSLPPQLAKYTIKIVNGEYKLTLSFNDGEWTEEYKGYEYGDGTYYFKPLTPNCVTDENTVFSPYITEN